MRKLFLTFILVLGFFLSLSGLVYGFDTNFALRLKHLRGVQRTPRMVEGLRLTSPRRSYFGPPSEVVFGKGAKVVTRKEMVFSDAGFSQPTHNFSSGQRVYVRLETNGGGDQEKTLRILDSDKKEWQRIFLDQSGQGPYVFTAAFLAPNDPGVYYLDIKISDGLGFSFSSQENINIGNRSADAAISSQAESIVESLPTENPGSEEKDPVLTPTPTPRPRVELESPKKPSLFVSPVVNWLKNFIHRLLGFLGLRKSSELLT